MLESLGHCGQSSGAAANGRERLFTLVPFVGGCVGFVTHGAVDCWPGIPPFPHIHTSTERQIQEVLTEVQRARFQPRQPEGATQILGPRARGTSSPL